jgi:hypothetical protein
MNCRVLARSAEQLQTAVQDFGAVITRQLAQRRVDISEANFRASPGRNGNAVSDGFERRLRIDAGTCVGRRHDWRWLRSAYGFG